MGSIPQALHVVHWQHQEKRKVYVLFSLYILSLLLCQYVQQPTLNTVDIGSLYLCPGIPCRLLYTSHYLQQTRYTSHYLQQTRYTLHYLQQNRYTRVHFTYFKPIKDSKFFNTFFLKKMMYNMLYSCPGSVRKYYIFRLEGYIQHKISLYIQALMVQVVDHSWE